MTKEGTILDGKYEILKEIGRGGMSIVYLARDNRLNKQWAVKEMKNDGSKSTRTLLKGLEREANILKNVDHPVLPRIIDIINNKGTIYVVMDFIEGTNLADVLKTEGAQPQDDVIEWSIQLASALDYLHSMNPPIIYRDMKPSNVMLKPEGGVKLIDFGTAKELTVENVADTTALGTRGYAAPEQFGDDQGRGIYKTDERTDIYNLGATMYHMVTGKNPNEPPYEIKPIRQWNPSLSTGLEKIILKCTQPNPNDRYQSCSELLYALDHYMELDESYRKQNVKKLTFFAVSAGLAIVFGICSLVGFSGRKRLNADYYSEYITSGDDHRISEDYVGAVQEYKNAIGVNSNDSEAYVRIIDTYIQAEESINTDDDSPSALELSDGLAYVASKVKDESSAVSRDSEVLYRLGLAYFTNLEDYNTAIKYFKQVDPNDEYYGKLAEYYGDISMILSSAVTNVESLMDSVNGFAEYNHSRIANTDEQKFINYETLGKIYTIHSDTPEVAESAETVLNQALTDLAEYPGDSQDFEYSYYDDLSVIYEKLAENGKEDYYQLAVEACDEVINQIMGKIDVGSVSSNEKVQSYNQTYVNKMCKKAELYGKMGDSDKAIATYEEAEKELGKGSNYAAKVYAEHLNYLYTMFEKKNKDPEKWSDQDKKTILDFLEEGSTVTGIEDNTVWIKRAGSLKNLEVGGSSEPEDKTDTSETEIDSSEESEE